MVFILPWIIFVSSFLAYPLLLAFRTSFLSINVLSPDKAAFVGFENWLNAIKDFQFWKSLFNVVYNQAFFIPISMALGLIFALLLFELGNKGVLYRILLFIPVVTSVPVAYIIFRDFAGTSGPIQKILVLSGLIDQSIDWAFTRYLPMPIIAVFNSWKWFGIQMLILLGGLHGINQSSFEAASVDGTNWFQKILFITLPQLKHQLIFILTVNIINGLQMFTEVYILFGSGGGMYGAGLTPVLYLYDMGFAQQKMGYASALGLLLAVVIFLVTIIQLKITNSDEE